jgi:hypothetical protein
VGIVPASSRAKVDMPMVDNKPTEYRFVMRAVGLDVYDRAVPTVDEANALTWAWQGGRLVGLLLLGMAVGATYRAERGRRTAPGQRWHLPPPAPPPRAPKRRPQSPAGPGPGQRHPRRCG